MKTEEIEALFEKWNQALQTGDPDQVVACYATDAILVPTLSPRVRHTHEEIRDYFVHFLSKQPVGRIVEQNVRVYGDCAINSGLYTFAVVDSAQSRGVPARFTFVYRQVDGEWRIVEHHSSLLP
jgi:uncharacterized protein (TIGR02246 family)